MPTIKKKGLGVKKEAEQEIMTIAHTVSAFMETYKKQLTITAVAAALVLVVWAGYALMRSLQEQKAAPLLAAAYEQYRPSGATADYQQALKLFREVQKEYPGTMSGAIAQYYVGNCLIALGQIDEATKEYQKFVNAYSGDKFLLGLVQQRLGYAYLSLGKQADAIKAFEQAEAITGPGLSTLELARLYEATGNVPNAQAKYKLIIDKLGGTPWAMEAMSKVQKIAPPVPGAAKEVK